MPPLPSLFSMLPSSGEAFRGKRLQEMPVFPARARGCPPRQNPEALADLSVYHISFRMPSPMEAQAGEKRHGTSMLRLVSGEAPPPLA